MRRGGRGFRQAGATMEMRSERRPATGADVAALHERLRRIEELLAQKRPHR